MQTPEQAGAHRSNGLGHYVLAAMIIPLFMLLMIVSIIQAGWFLITGKEGHTLFEKMLGDGREAN